MAQADLVERSDDTVVGFPLPVEDAQLQAELVEYIVDEGGAVGRVADGAGRRG